MKKKLLIFLLTAATAVSGAFGLAACKKKNSTTDENQYNSGEETPGGNQSNTSVGFPNDGKTYILFDANGGSFEMGTTKLEEQSRGNTANAASENPERFNYVFSGWAKDRAGEQMWDFSSDVITGNTTLYAVWVRSCLVVYDANGGTFSRGEVVQSVQSYKGASLSSAETPVRSGYSFRGWFKDAECTEQWNFSSDKVSADVTLYAGWTSLIDEYTVWFYLGYSGADVVERTTSNGYVSFIPEREGYIFGGWWDSEYSDARQVDLTQPITRDVTLYARWIDESEYAYRLEAPTLTVSDGQITWNEVEGATGYTVAIYYGGEEKYKDTTSSLVFSFPSYYDVGNYTVKVRSNGDGKTTANSVYASCNYTHKVLKPTTISFDISNSILTWTAVNHATSYEVTIDGVSTYSVYGTSYDMSSYEVGDYNISIMAIAYGYDSSTAGATVSKLRLKSPDCKVYLRQDGAQYGVEWDSVSHADSYIVSVNGTERTVHDTHCFVDTQDATVEVYAFDSSADFLISKEAYSFDMSTHSKLTIDDGDTEGGEFEVSYYNSRDIYGVPAYQVSFDLNGGAGEVQSQKVRIGESPLFPEIPTRNNYLFAGWFNNEQCTGSAYNFEDGITEDLQLYAKWIFTSEDKLALNDSRDIQVYGSTSSLNQYYAFAPVVDGRVTIYSTGETDTLGYLYDSHKNQIEYNDDGGTNHNFSISYDVKAGELYYVKVVSFSGSGNTTLNIAFSVPQGGVVNNVYLSPSHVVTNSEVLVPNNKRVSLVAYNNSGYIFAGWYNGETNISHDMYADITLTEDTTVDARWIAIPYTVQSNTAEGGRAYIYSHASKIGDSVTAYAETLKDYGYEWLGWYNGDTLLSTEMSYTFTVSEDAVTYTAKWKYFTVNAQAESGGLIGTDAVVTYILNGGSGSISDQIVNANSPLVYPHEIPTRSGYVFRGWFAADEYYTPYDFTAPLTGDITLYARWTSIDYYSNAYYPNFAEENNTSADPLVIDVSNSYNSPYYVYFTALTSGIYTLYYKNYSSSNGTSMYIYNQTQSSTVKSTATYYNTEYAYINISVNAGDVLYVKTYCSYSQTLYMYMSGAAYPADGATTGVQNISKVVETGDQLTLSAATMGRYVFDGWYIGDELVSADAEYTVTMGEEDVNIVAKWICYTVTVEVEEGGSVCVPAVVSFDLNGGTGSVPSQTVTLSTPLEYPLQIPVKDGCVFKGWYLQNSSTPYDFSATVEGDITLYAGWEVVSLSNVYSTQTVNFATDYNSSSTALAIDTSYTTSSSKKYVVFTAPTDANVTFYYRNSSSTSSYGTYFRIYNVTQEYVVISNSYACTNTSYYSASHVVHAGDVLYMSFYRYSNSATFYVYATGFDMHADGGVTEGHSSQFAQVGLPGDEMTFVADPIPGYTFNGWYSGNTLLSDDPVYVMQMSEQNVAITAKWVVYTLTVNIDEGGTYPTSSVSFNLNGAGGTAPETQYLNENTALIYPEIPVRSGYLFGGWYTDSDCTGSPYDFTATVSGDITLYAKWLTYTATGTLTLNQTVNLYFNSKNSSYNYYAFVPLTSGTVTIYSSGSWDTYGYLFNSSKNQLTYNDDAGGSGNFLITYSVTAGNLYYVSPCGYSTSGYSNLTIEMAMPSDGGYGAASNGITEQNNSAQVTAGESFNVRCSTVQGYTFIGWYDENDNLVSTLEDFDYVMPESNVTLTAKFSRN